MWEAIVAGLKILASTLGIIEKQGDRKNAPDVKQGAKNVQEQKEMDKINDHVEKGDLEKMRQDAAE